MENYNMQELPHKRCVYEQGSIDTTLGATKHDVHCIDTPLDCPIDWTTGLSVLFLSVKLTPCDVVLAEVRSRTM